LLIDELGQSSQRMTAIRNRHAPRTHRISWDNHNPKQLIANSSVSARGLSQRVQP
jgi:hypothetical protein